MSGERPYGRYILEERIAMGGMAEIFRARIATQGFEKRVCIKRVLPHFLESEDFVTMFRDEARLAARLQHQNVVQMFDFGEEGGTLFLAMELVDGADLRRLLDRAHKRHLRLGIGQAAQIAIEMARGLHHAHTLIGDDGTPLSIVHRDISPHNVLLGRSGEVKITDFGIAKAAERASHTSTGVVKGKLSYMAPEQADGSAIDHRVDQFATGLVLFECLTGEKLFAGDNEAIILRKVLTCDVAPPSSRRHDVPKELDQVVMKALAPSASDRYPDMRAFEQALTRVTFLLSDDPAFTDLRPLVEQLVDDQTSGPRKTAVMRGPAVAEASGVGAVPRDRVLGPPPSAASDVEAGEASAVFASGPESKKQLVAHAALRDAGLLADQGAETVMAGETVVGGEVPDFLEASPVEPGDSTEPTRTIVPKETLASFGPEPTVTSPEPADVEEGRADATALELTGSGDFSAAPEPPAAFPRRSDLEAVVPTERVPRAAGPATSARERRGRAPVVVGGVALAAVLVVVAAVGLGGQGEPASPTSSAPAPPPEEPAATDPPRAPVSTPPPEQRAATTEAAAPVEPASLPEPTPLPEPAPPPSADEPAGKKPEKRREPSREARRPAVEERKAEVARAAGKVFVDVVGSWATVYEGKKRLGETPVTLQLPAGKHRLRLQNPETGRERTIVVDVEAGRLVKAVQKL